MSIELNHGHGLLKIVWSLASTDPKISKALGWVHKSLARPDWKNNWKVAIFHPTWRSLLQRRPGWTDSLLNFFL